MLKIIAIIQARMLSTRLPSKILMQLQDKTVLNHVVNRVAKADAIDKVIVATSSLPSDDAVINECDKIGVEYFRGDINNVLERYYKTAEFFKAENILRITSDCPCISPNLINNMVENYLKNKPDYLSNTIKRTYPRGLDAEIFTFETLKKTYHEASNPHEKEHVTPYIYQNPDKFNIKSFTDRKDNSKYRWTLDTIEDFRLIEKIYENLYLQNNDFEYEDILDLFDKYPKLFDINKDIEQKKL